MKSTLFLAAILSICCTIFAGCAERLSIGTTEYSFEGGPLAPGTTIAVLPEHGKASMYDWAIHKGHIEWRLDRAGFVVVPEQSDPTLLCLASYSRQLPEASNATSQAGQPIPVHRLSLKFARAADRGNPDSTSVMEMGIESHDKRTDPDQMIAALIHLAFLGWPGEDGTKYDAGVHH